MKRPRVVAPVSRKGRAHPLKPDLAEAAELAENLLDMVLVVHEAFDMARIFSKKDRATANAYIVLLARLASSYVAERQSERLAKLIASDEGNGRRLAAKSRVGRVAREIELYVVDVQKRLDEATKVKEIIDELQRALTAVHYAAIIARADGAWREPDAPSVEEAKTEVMRRAAVGRAP